MADINIKFPILHDKASCSISIGSLTLARYNIVCYEDNPSEYAFAYDGRLYANRDAIEKVVTNQWARRILHAATNLELEASTPEPSIEEDHQWIRQGC